MINIDAYLKRLEWLKEWIAMRIFWCDQPETFTWKRLQSFEEWCRSAEVQQKLREIQYGRYY